MVRVSKGKTNSDPVGEENGCQRWMALTLLQSEQGVTCRGECQTTDAITPLLLGTSELNVLVDDAGDDHGKQGVVPRGHEHYSDAE